MGTAALAIASNPSPAEIAQNYAQGPYNNPTYNYNVAVSTAARYGVDPSALTWNGTAYVLSGAASSVQGLGFVQGQVVTGAPNAAGVQQVAPLNPLYFADDATAAKIAALVGGKVIQGQWIDVGGQGSAPLQNGIQLPSGATFNAGLLASTIQSASDAGVAASNLSAATGVQVDPVALAAVFGTPVTTYTTSNANQTPSTMPANSVGAVSHPPAPGNTATTPGAAPGLAQVPVSANGAPATSQAQNPAAAPLGGTANSNNAIYNAILAASGGNPNALMTADNWGYYYQQVTGTAGPAPELYGFTGDGRQARVTLSQWWGMLQGYLGQGSNNTTPNQNQAPSAAGGTTVATPGDGGVIPAGTMPTMGPLQWGLLAAIGLGVALLAMRLK